MLRLKTAIVTGASSGLGRALALRLLRRGYRVVLVGRNEAALRKVSENASEARILLADLADASQTASLVDKSTDLLGVARIDLLVNCAGMAVTGRAEDISEAQYEKCWRVNFTSAVSLARQVLPRMKSRRAGTIVNVSSGVARRALPYISPYCSAKAALNSFTESLRVEVACFGIKVMLFSPGPVTSNFHEATEHCGSTKLAFPPFRGVDADRVAEKLERAIVAGKTRVVLGLRASVAYHLNYWIPKLTDFIVGSLYRLEIKP